MPSVKFPVGAFRTATRDYTREDYNKGVDACFWRELLQNSRDAGAGRVDISLKTEGNITTVVYEDNGTGMSWETLENGMLTYSGTIKPNGAAGGFGMAKCLLVFAPNACQIDTREHSVYIQGIDWDKLPSTENIKGTRFTITIDNTGFSTDLQITPTIEGLRFLMDRSNMGDMKVVCNGERVYNTSLVPSAEPIRQWEEYKTSVYHLPKETPVKNTNGNPIVAVQHRGIWVMDMAVNPEVKGAVFVNIEDDAIKVLNASRVGIAIYDLRNNIQNFISELAQSPKEAVRTKKFVQRWDGSFNTITSKEKEAKDIASNIRYAQEDNPSKGVQQWIADNSAMVAGLFKPTAEGSIPSAAFDPSRLVVDGLDSYDLSQQLLTMSWSPAFMLVNDREQDISAQFLPETMGARAKQVLAVWSEMVKQFLLLTRSYGVTYGVGFVFCDDRQAEWRKEKDGTTWFLINPIGEDGSMRFGMSDSVSRSKMIALAAHEVTHEIIEENYHGDRFANKLTDMMTIAFDNSQVFNTIWKNKGK